MGYQRGLAFFMSLKRSATILPVGDFIGLPARAFDVQPRQMPLSTAPPLPHSTHFLPISILIVSITASPSQSHRPTPNNQGTPETSSRNTFPSARQRGSW